jgi:hypothetical protein
MKTDAHRGRSPEKRAEPENCSVERSFVGVRTSPPELDRRPAESVFGVRTGSQASEIVPLRWTCRSHEFAGVRRRPLCVAPHLAPQSGSFRA